MESREIEQKSLEQTILEITSSRDIQDIFIQQGEEQENVYMERILPLIYPDTPTFENTKRIIAALIGIVGGSNNQEGIDQNTRDCAIAIMSLILKDFPHEISRGPKSIRTKTAEKKTPLKLITRDVYNAYICTLKKQHEKDNVDPYGEIASLLIIAPLIVDLPLTPDQLTELEVTLFYLRYIPYSLALDPYRKSGKYIKDLVSGLGIGRTAQSRRALMDRRDERSKR